MAKGIGKTASLSNCTELSWLDICRSIVALYPDRDAGKLKDKVKGFYAEVTGGVDWTSISLFIHRVPAYFFKFMDEWMQSHGLVLVPIPLTWIRDGTPVRQCLMLLENSYSWKVIFSPDSSVDVVFCHTSCDFTSLCV